MDLSDLSYMWRERGQSGKSFGFMYLSVIVNLIIEVEVYFFKYVRMLLF